MDAPSFPQLSFEKRQQSVNFFLRILNIQAWSFAGQRKVCGRPYHSADSFATATKSNLPISGGRTDADEKLASSRFQSAILGGSPCIGETRLTAEHVYKTCAGCDSDAHVRDRLKDRPDLTAKQIKQAIAFERNRREI